MERLTNYDDHNGYWSFSGDTQIEEHCDTAYAGSLIVRGEIIDRLAAYEDTGMMPEEVAELAPMLQEFQQNTGVLRHIHELIQAEADGRLIVLPCKVGDTLYTFSAIKGFTMFTTNFESPDIHWIIDNKDCFGKTVFLTREEAEAALAKEKQCTT